MVGSSPHTRGARHLDRRRMGRAGIIPAYAGSTAVALPAAKVLGDHPRIRGEHRSESSRFDSKRGSSPHTRGALVAVPLVGEQGGIIPAYAGSTWWTATCSACGRDHPRIRGEHVRVAGDIIQIAGSSPHTRGAQYVWIVETPGDGIIPAYAGSTGTLPIANGGTGDHPRIRGEHFDHIVGRHNAGGSSPHTRGARILGRSASDQTGIIPAYAGSTRKPAAAVCPSRDHPRIRGEHLVRGCPIASPRGSSPHTRGAPHGTRRKPATTGIIPAYAGSTTIDPWRKTRCRDHPRIRGEHNSKPLLSRMGKGSSPHTRGAPRLRLVRHRADGIIPAYAGSTTGRAR